MDLDRIWVRRLLRIVIPYEPASSTKKPGYGFFPDVEDEAYGLFTDLYRIWGRRLADFLWIWTGFGGGGLRIVFGFGPDLGEKAYGFPTGLCFLADGFCADFCRSAYGLLGLKRVLVGAGEENHPPEEDVKKMRCKCWQCRQSMVCLPVVVKSLVLVVVHSRPMSWFGNLVLVVVKTHSPEIGGSEPSIACHRTLLTCHVILASNDSIFHIFFSVDRNISLKLPGMTTGSTC